MKLLLTILLTIFINFSFSQNIQVVTINGDPLLRVSINNLVRLAEMPFSQFSPIMKQYNYTYRNDNSYLWQGGGVGSPYFGITKDIGEAGFIWTNNSLDMIMAFKDELLPIHSGYRNGNSIFRFSNNGRRYEITLGETFALLVIKP